MTRPWEPTHRHVKRGSEYRMLGVGFVELKDEFAIYDNNPVALRLDKNDVYYINRFAATFNLVGDETYLGTARAQVSDGQVIRNGDAVVVYQGNEGRLWVRPFEQFMDGRFVQITALSAKLTEALWLFREFTIRNATQWKMGCNHHHPMWWHIAEFLQDKPDVQAGPEWRFIQPENKEALELLKEEYGRAV